VPLDVLAGIAVAEIARTAVGEVAKGAAAQVGAAAIKTAYDAVVKRFAADDRPRSDPFLVAVERSRLRALRGIVEACRASLEPRRGSPETNAALTWLAERKQLLDQELGRIDQQPPQAPARSFAAASLAELQRLIKDDGEIEPALAGRAVAELVGEVAGVGPPAECYVARLKSEFLDRFQAEFRSELRASQALATQVSAAFLTELPSIRALSEGTNALLDEAVAWLKNIHTSIEKAPIGPAITLKRHATAELIGDPTYVETHEIASELWAGNWRELDAGSPPTLRWRTGRIQQAAGSAGLLPTVLQNHLNRAWGILPDPELASPGADRRLLRERPLGVRGVRLAATAFVANEGSQTSHFQPFRRGSTGLDDGRWPLVDVPLRCTVAPADERPSWTRLAPGDASELTLFIDLWLETRSPDRLALLRAGQAFARLLRDLTLRVDADLQLQEGGLVSFPLDARIHESSLGRRLDVRDVDVEALEPSWRAIVRAQLAWASDHAAG
jgi:hypothetical protein